MIYEKKSEAKIADDKQGEGTTSMQRLSERLLMEVSPGFKLPYRTVKAPLTNPMALTSQLFVIKALVVPSIFIQYKKIKLSPKIFGLKNILSCFQV